MPTTRLTHNERNDIKSNFIRVLKRCRNNKQFPVEKEDILTWGIGLVDPEALEKWGWLKEHAPKLVRHGTVYSTTVTICDDYRYSLGIQAGGFPQDGLEVPRTHEDYAAILEWTLWAKDISAEINQAASWLRICTDSCHSVGQFKRVMGDEILKYVPHWLTDSLKDAERRSRLPERLNIDLDRHAQLKNTLALGALSPEEYSGLEVKYKGREIL